MLYLVATPIGNLADITYRAVRVLGECDLILCEDTRTSLILLTHYGIQKPLRSYHKFNEAKVEQKVLSYLRAGKNMALLSDAGTPGIADPGQRLMALCRKERIAVSILPGACAALAALSLSGYQSDRFQFVGFLPKKISEKKLALVEMAHYSGTSICFEAPQRLVETLSLLPKGQLCAVARELTKIYEECLEGTAEELGRHFTAHPPRGELVLLVQGVVPECSLSPLEHVRLLQEEYGLPEREAIKVAAQVRGVPKREIYNLNIK